jgi:beta-lactamase regulating signal transducer with metallopeptidase domain
MLALLLESALRSLLLGAAVWLGLKLFRVRNPHVQMTAWTLVLVASLAMPALMRLVTVTIPAAAPAPLAQIIWPAPVMAPPAIESAPQPARPILSPPSAAAHEASAPRDDTVEIAPRRAIDWRTAATAVYLAVGGMLLVRLVIGVVLTWRLVRAARPVRAHWAAGGDVRVSDVVGVPVTFASTILLPSEHATWSSAKRRAVLTHERAHVMHGDFYVLLLAAINRAVFWFNPFAWWQFTRLAELAEIISDDAALEALDDRPRYAGILLDVARRRQGIPAALAMARPATVRRRVERILATHEAPARAGWRLRMLVAGALLPLVALCAVTVARGTPPVPSVQAATEPREPSNPALARYAGFYQAGPRTVLAIAAEGERLSAQFTGQRRFELTRASETDYVSTTPPMRVSFAVDGEAPASALVLHQSNREWRARRIDALSARDIETAFAQRIATVPDRFREQTPAPGSRAALLHAIEELQRGTPDYARMSPQLANALRPQLTQLSGMLTTLGPVQSVFFRGVGPGGYDIYGAQFANGAAEFRLSVAIDGMIDDLLFRPNGDDTPGEVLACAQEAALQATAGTAPIRLTLFNESGAEIRLYGINTDGTHQLHGTIGADRTRVFLTNAGRPLVIADAAGRCLEILVPGLRTRFLLVQSDRPAAEPAWPSRRVAPRAGSEEALRQHIEALARGEPRYEMMSEEAAAETRQQLLLQQAILARLGPLRAMSFRAATQLDSDVYMAQFANGAAEWRIRLLKDGRIGGLALGPQY